MGNKAKRYFCVVLLVIFGVSLWGGEHNNVRPRAREAGIAPGVLPPIKLDITESQIGHGRQKRTGWRNSMEGQKTTCTFNKNLFL